MPDWSYGTGSRSLLFLLDAARARDLTLSAIGGLADLPGGTGVIALLGHMDPPARLRRTVMGLDLRGPVGLGAGLDVDARATRAFARFGFGFIELGPVGAGDPAGPIVRDVAAQSIRYEPPFASVTAERLRDALARRRRTVAYIARLGLEGYEHAMAVLAPHVDAFSVQIGTADAAPLIAAAQARPLLIVIPPDTAADRAAAIGAAAVRAGAAGISVAGGLTREGLIVVGGRTRSASLDLVRHLRHALGPDVPIIASGGIIEPADALAALAAGATLVQLHSGFVYSGPGLPKRINEAIAARDAVPTAPAPVSPRYAWTALGLLGIGMIVSGTAAWLVAVTSTLLDYDEEFVGISRAAIAAIDPRLPGFMSHDRVSLAAGMISVGVLYAALAAFGVRSGAHWARAAIVVSATVGFASFGLFLGYRYFDPLHAVVTLLLLPFFVLGVRSAMTEDRPVTANLRNDGRWRAGLWGQLSFVALGAGLIAGGATICLLGTSVVFVPSDLDFLRTTARTLGAANARLLPLIAHDRAGLGGLLVSEGVVVFLTSLWGFREGARWLWWTYLVAGTIGFAGAIGVHFTIAYLDVLHLLPAFAALALFVIGLIASFPYLWHLPARPPATARLS